MWVERTDAAERHIYEGWYHREERQLLARLGTPGGTVIDVGANVGVMTIAAALVVGARGRVHSFKPNPAIADRLRRNTAVLPQVDVTQVAVGARVGRARLNVSAGNAGTSSLWEDYFSGPRSCVDVQVAPLDDLLPDAADVDVLKIDVEGYEGEVLAGASRLVGAHAVRHFLLEWSNWGPPERRNWLPALLGELGDAYVCRRVTSATVRGGMVLAPALAPFSWDDAASIASVNVLVSRADQPIPREIVTIDA